MPRLALAVHKTAETFNNAHNPPSIECSIAMSQLVTPIVRKNIPPKRTSHKHDQMPGWETSGHDVGNVVKHNSEGEVIVTTIFGNYNVASRGTRRIQTTTQQSLAHGKTSSQNSQKGSEQLGIFSTKFVESTRTAQVIPNNRKGSTSSTATTTNTASKRNPRPARSWPHCFTNSKDLMQT